MSDADNGSLLWAAGGIQFATILVDPPWPSKSRDPKSGTGNWLRDHTKPRYNTMRASDILSLPVRDIALPDSMLVMWATWMHLPLAIKVMEAWGYIYATGMPWLKVVQEVDTDHRYRSARHIMAPIYGPGVWFQHCTELILIGRRGHPFGKAGNPRPARKGIIIAPRRGHSRKPVELQDWIDAKFPGPKIELFARECRPGWTQWGDELV